MLVASVGVSAMSACDYAPTLAGGRTCLATVQFSPLSLNLFVGDSAVVAMSLDGGCSPPAVRNETPAVVAVDSLTVGTFQVRGLAAGAGQVRLLSPVDTTVTRALTVVVTAR